MQSACPARDRGGWAAAAPVDDVRGFREGNHVSRQGNDGRLTLIQSMLALLIGGVASLVVEAFA